VAVPAVPGAAFEVVQAGVGPVVGGCDAAASEGLSIGCSDVVVRLVRGDELTGSRVAVRQGAGAPAGQVDLSAAACVGDLFVDGWVVYLKSMGGGSTNVDGASHPRLARVVPSVKPSLTTRMRSSWAARCTRRVLDASPAGLAP